MPVPVPDYYEFNDGNFFTKNKNGKIKSISKELFLKKKLNHSGGSISNLLKKGSIGKLVSDTSKNLFKRYNKEIYCT